MLPRRRTESPTDLRETAAIGMVQSVVPSSKHTKNDGTSPFFMGKSTISMAMFNSFLYVYRGILFLVIKRGNGTFPI